MDLKFGTLGSIFSILDPRLSSSFSMLKTLVLLEVVSILGTFLTFLTNSTSCEKLHLFSFLNRQFCAIFTSNILLLKMMSLSMVGVHVVVTLMHIKALVSKTAVAMSVVKIAHILLIMSFPLVVHELALVFKHILTVKTFHQIY